MKCVETLKKETTSTNINDEQSNIFSLFEKRAHQLMIENYKLIEINYNILITNNLLCNGKCHLVALFKEYLIDDDNSEFLRRYYTTNESIIRIKKVAKYYFETSVIFPNYTPLSEAKYIYRNIMKKQKVIDQQQELEDEKEENKKWKFQRNDSNKKVFDTVVYNDILNQSESILRIIFGINRPKNKNKNENNNNKDNNNIENEISIEELQNIENIIDEIKKYENNQNKSMKPQIKISETLKSKLQLKMPKRKNTPKIAITNSNIRTMLEYKKKKIPKKAKSPSLTKNNNNHTHNHNNNNKSISIVSRNLTNNFTLTTNSSISTSHYKSHKTNYSMPKIYFIIQGKKNYTLHSFKSIDSNTITNENDMLKNLFNSSPRKKTHKKIRSALGRNNINNTEEKNSTCYKNKDENKRKKSFQIKKIKDMDLILKSNLIFPENYVGFYTDRIKK